MSKDSPPDKREVARSLLLRGSMFVHLDPRVEGVVVPPWLRKQPQLVLQMGLDMVVPIVDLRIDRDGVYGTLSFNRSPFTCIVGWDAIFALSGDDGRGMVWPESMPPEILAEVEREAGRRGPVPLSAVADLQDDYDDYDDDDDDYDQPDHGKGRPGNVIRLAPKLSAVQGGLSQQAKSAPSAPPAAPRAVPVEADEGVRERDTLELVETHDSSHEPGASDASSADAGSSPDAGSPELADGAETQDEATDVAKDGGGPQDPATTMGATPDAASERAKPNKHGKNGKPAQATAPADPDASTGATDDDDEPEPPTPPRGSHLRLVK